MSTIQSDAGAYLRRIIACEYYDGAMAGVGERARDGAAVWFRVVAWDDEQWRRVFAVATVDAALRERLVQDLEKVEPRKEPFWLPEPPSVTSETKNDWDQIAAAAARSDSWLLVEAHDLDDAAAERAVPVADVPRVIACVRAGTVLAASGPSLTDSFLQQIQSHAG